MASSIRSQQRKLTKKFRENPVLWIERCLKILTPKNKVVSFKLNKIQRIYWKQLKKLYLKPFQLDNGKWTKRLQGVREVNLKARQFGLSSFICALLLHDMTFFENTKNWVFCQDDDAVKIMLEEKIKFYYQSIDRDDDLVVLPDADVSNSKEYGFTETGSRIKARIPGKSKSVSRGKGRSITLRGALLSELAEWPFAGELIQGLRPALEDETTNIFIESSPRLKGDYFYNFYQLAKSGQSKWKARFWPWYLHDKYQAIIGSEEDRQAIRDSYTDEEKKFIEYVKLEWMMDITEEQMLWRRQTKADPQLAAKGPMAFIQEYPENDKDCFEATGKSIFYDPDVNLQTLTTVKREAIPGNIHIISADVADGAGGDNSVIHVIDAVTQEQIYKWSSNLIDSTQLHREIHRVWQRFPGVVGIETNGIGRATISQARNDKTLVKNEKGEMVELCKDWDEFVHCGNKTYDGMPTLGEKSNTIYLMRAAIREAVEHYTKDPESKLVVGLRLSDQDTVDEMDHFQKLDGNKMGAPEGSGAHDDHLMGLSVGFRLLSEVWDYDKIFKRRFAHVTV